MRLLGGILALIIGIAGWYYLFYSRAAHRLSAVEPGSINLRRKTLRRINGAVMLLLAVLIYAGMNTEKDQAFLVIWMSVCLLLAVVLSLAIADLWFTARIRRKR